MSILPSYHYASPSAALIIITKSSENPTAQKQHLLQFNTHVELVSFLESLYCHTEEINADKISTFFISMRVFNILFRNTIKLEYLNSM